MRPFIGVGYDALAWLVYSPIGGQRALREGALNAIGILPGERVLELGCGTGGLTEKLIARGASVTAVDWSEPMLRRARRRAPGATFVRSEITEYTPDRTYDLVLFAFVLHELMPDARARALKLARRALTPHGSVAVVDHAEPPTGVLPRAIFRFMRAFEPASMIDWARSGFEPELEAAGFIRVKRTALARGAALVVVANPAAGAR